MTRRKRFIRRLEHLGFTHHFKDYWVRENPDRPVYAWLGEDGFCIDSGLLNTDLVFSNFIELEEAIIYESLREET